jgi:hypothetical protein
MCFLLSLSLSEENAVASGCHCCCSIAFMVLGTLVLPVWEPNLGQVVVIFTLLVPSE